MYVYMCILYIYIYIRTYTHICAEEMEDDDAFDIFAAFFGVMIMIIVILNIIICNI